MDAPVLRGSTVAALAAGVLLLTATSALAAPPHISGGSRVAGTAQVGAQVASTAAWTGDTPIRARWTWYRCTSMDLGDCATIAGAHARGYEVRGADLGVYLRSKVRVSNARGWAWAMSAPSEAVVAAAAPAPASPDPGTGGVLGASDEHLPLLDPFPVVRIRGWLTARGVRVEALSVRAPRGARVTISCAGPGCPRGAWSRTASLVHLKPFEVPLRAGVRLTITVTRPGAIGKHTVITVRHGTAPTRRDRCLYPGSTRPRACPAA
jgi:hypothetical protein